MTSESRYLDRRHGGRVLASALMRYSGKDDVDVLALPRGGVPVAYEVSTRLHAPLDVFLVRKLGLPGAEEIAMGAIASGGVRVLNWELIGASGVSQRTIDEVAATEQKEIERQERAYRGAVPALDVEGHVVILVDDGLATGATMAAAVKSVRRLGPRSIVVGVPVASPETCAELAHHVDDIVCAATPEPFVAVGLWYANFEQTSDLEVRALLEAARALLSSTRHD